MPRILQGWPGRETALGILAVVLVGLAWSVGVLNPLERPVTDILMRIPSPRTPAKSPFSAVLIDDRAVERFGPLPWPREQLAALVGGIRQSGGAGIVIDILLSDEGFEPADFRLAETLDDGPTVLAATLNTDGTWNLPANAFGGAAIAAHANAEIEGDGVIRTFSYTKQAGDLSLEALSVAAARLAGWRGEIVPGMVFRPDFLVKPADIPQMSAIDILERDPPTQLLADRVVFLGVSATGSTDQFITPVSRWHQPTAGVLVHSAAAASVLRGGLLHNADHWQTAVAALLAALGIQGLRTRAGRLRIRHLCIVAIFVIGGSLLALWIFKTILPVVGLLVAATGSAFLREAVESRDVQAETGKILQSLVREGGSDYRSPKGAHERLRLARLLQKRIINDRNVRRQLLEGLDEGVILWDGHGRPRISNRALGRLWGGIPSLSEVLHTAGIGGLDEVGGFSQPRHLQHRKRSIEVRIQDTGDGHLGVVRDRSLEEELERQRQEMQRLVSHELKTPLSSLAGFGSLLERYPMTEEEIQRTAGLIRTEAERLGEMVRTFLDLERLGTGRWNEDRVTLDLPALVANRCKILSAAAAEKRVEIDVRADDTASILGVPHLVEQVVDNLIGNALKFAPEDSLVGVEVTAGSSVITFSVQDSGPGIPPDSIPHLFDRFYRVPGTGTKGSGLGLALVQEVLEHHQATVKVESAVGKGSTFIVEFPFPETSGEAP